MKTTSIILIAFAMAMVLALPSCSAIRIFGEGVTADIHYRNPQTGAKAGLDYRGGQTRAYARRDWRDAQTGEVIARTRLEKLIHADK